MLNPKSQIPISTKSQLISNYPMSNWKLVIGNLLDIGNWSLVINCITWTLVFGFCALLFGFLANVYAFNLDKIKVHFLEGDYKSAILEGEKLLVGEAKSARSDELYYILGLSYLKDGNYLRASDIFEIILKEFKNSAFKEEAKLGLGDTYFLRADYDRAKKYYQELTNSNSRSKLVAPAYYRLSQCAFKQGNIQEGKEYLSKLKQKFPLNPELILNKDLCLLSNASDFYYTVQVGAFSNITNARNLTDKLIQNGYPAYMQELSSTGGPSYRVRVGKFRLRQEAEELESKLSQEGYPTKICP